MSLRIVTSRANVNKSGWILDQIKNELKTNSQGKPIFYIVPEQMTFQQEYAMFQDGEVNGSIRAQVVSFSRLAWRVLQETGGSTRQFISSTGTQMMLRKIIEQRTEPFQMFQKAADKQGFVQELEGIMTEFKRHCISPEMLEEQLNFTKENQALQHKLSDLYYIYAQLQRMLENKYIDGEDQLQLLTEKVTSTAFLQDAEIYIDGFHRFTPNELGVIVELLKVSRSMTVVLTLDDEVSAVDKDELDLFYQTAETYQTLLQIAEEHDVVVERVTELEPTYHVLKNNAELAHIEQYFDIRPTPVYSYASPSAVQVAEAVHPRAELDGIIQEILRLVREENYRYRDMVIFVREPEEYNDLIQTMFHDYNIPVFIDEKQTMLNHPLIEFIRSIFDMVESNWSYEAVFRVLKTGLIPATHDEYPLDMDAIDELENYVLEFGIRYKSQWLQEERWVYKRFQGFTDAAKTDKEMITEEKINAYRNQVVTALELFDQEIRKQQTVKNRCKTIFELLQHVHIPAQLGQQRLMYEGSGKVEQAREAEQVWNGLIQLLDEMVEMIGDEKMPFSLYHKTLEAGLESLEFSHVPPTMDHVIVGSIDHSRITSKKCAFLIGVNEGSWPMKPAIDGMINEQEREYLQQFGLELAESNRRILLDDTFYMYLAFTTATDYLWISYVLSTNEGAKRTVSSMVNRIRAFFPSLKDPMLLTEPDDLQRAERFITTDVKTRAPLTSQLARYLRGYSIEDTWWDVLHWYMEHEPKYGTTYKVLQSLFYENKPQSLSEDTVEALYPRQVKASVSRLEMLYRCSYQHYAQYSLQLEDRRTYKLDAPDIGQLFHEALKTITQWLQYEGKDFAELTKKESSSYAQKSMSHLAPALQHHILSSTNRYKYIQKKLQDVIAQATYILSEQARASGFSPVGIELGFGFSDGLNPLQINLPNGYELLLRGRIDRVDKSVIEDELFLRIIDYKSSSRGLDLVDVYYGLALQMLTYLDVVLSQSKKWLGMEASPAGILYFHVHDAMVSEESDLHDDELAEQLFKKYKMNGLVRAEEEIARLMDTSLDSGASDIVPVGFKKNGDFYSNSKIADEHSFSLLQQHMHQLIEKAGIQMTTGEVLLNPYENSKGNACTFCDFKSVCQFDPILAENNFRRLQPLKEADVYQHLNEQNQE